MNSTTPAPGTIGSSHKALGFPYQMLVIGGFAALFPGFFFYHTLLGTGTTGAFLGGYFAPMALTFCVPVLALHVRHLRRTPQRLTRIDLHYALFFAYFLAVVAANAAAGASRAVVQYHLLAVVFMVVVYLLFCHIDFDGRHWRILGLSCLALMSGIVFAYSQDGVFYLGALGIAKDANALATYQGFSRSYLFTYLAVVVFTRHLPLRLVLHGVGAATLYLNTARSEFAALMLCIPLIEFYYARHKMLFVITGIVLATVLAAGLEDLLAALPSNRILELLDLSHSTSANKRQQLTLHAMQTISAHPILGDYGSYQPGHYSHNVLSAWVDLGALGLLYVLALTTLPVAPLFVHEYFAGRQRPWFLLAFIFACATLLLLLTSHYFTDMLLSATLGACSRYHYERNHGAYRPPELGPSPPRHEDLRQTVSLTGRARS